MKSRHQNKWRVKRNLDEVNTGNRRNIKNNPIRGKRVAIVYETRTIFYKKTHLENKNETLDIKKKY